MSNKIKFGVDCPYNVKSEVDNIIVGSSGCISCNYCINSNKVKGYIRCRKKKATPAHLGNHDFLFHQPVGKKVKVNTTGNNRS